MTDWLLQCLCLFSCYCWNWLLRKGSEGKLYHRCSKHTFWGGRRIRHFSELHLVSMHWASSLEVRKQASILQESGKFPACRNTVRHILLFMSKEWIFYSDSWGECRPLKWLVSTSMQRITPGWPRRNTAHSQPGTCRIPCLSTCRDTLETVYVHTDRKIQTRAEAERGQLMRAEIQKHFCESEDSFWLFPFDSDTFSELDGTL